MKKKIFALLMIMGIVIIIESILGFFNGEQLVPILMGLLTGAFVCFMGLVPMIIFKKYKFNNDNMKGNKNE